MDNTHNLSTLLHEYIDIFRGLQTEQGHAINTYLNSQREMNRALIDLLFRYLEIERQTRNISNQSFSNSFSNNRTRIPPPPSRIPPSVTRFPETTPSLFSFNPTNNRSLAQSPIDNTPLNFSFPSNTNNSNSNTRPRTRGSNRSVRSLRPRDIPIPSNRNRRNRRNTRIRTTTNVTTATIPRDIFQNFINNTLNMGNIAQPLSSADISANITNLTYNEVDSGNTQTICPFTQDNFQENDEISRINACGHIFTRSHLHRYLSNFDYRCPVCRRDLRRENDVENPTTTTNNLLDISNNIHFLSNNSNSQETRNIINNAVESVTNALMSNISNQISTDPSRNSFVAEYSFLLPSFNNTTNLTTNLTPNFTSTADLDLHDYLGLPPRNNSTQTNSSPALPPLPEDSENDIFEETQFISDDEDL